MSEFKIIIAGGRDFDDYELLSQAITVIAESQFPDKQIAFISGMARGADALGYMFCHKNNIKCYEYYADWSRHGNKAGFIRNERMGRDADALIAFWDGKSRGTDHMIKFMYGQNKPVYIIKY